MHNNIYGVRLTERSTLYNIEPVGLGTSMVESFTSYITRLSNAHNIKVKHMLQFVVYPILQNNEYIYQNIINSSYKFSKYVIGNNFTTLDFINALEKLTSRLDLRYLTFISWKEIITQKSISNYKKWCPLCLNTMKENNSTVYQPLLWNLRCVNICHIHNSPLKSKCPKCNKIQLHLSNKGNIANCHKCNSWLGDDVAIDKNSKNVNDEFSMWAAQSCGELIGIAPKALSFPTRSFGLRLIEELECNSQIFIENVLFQEINFENSKSKIASSLIYNLSTLTTCGRHGNQEYFDILLKLIFFIGAPIRILYDSNSLNIFNFNIYNELKQQVEKSILQRQVSIDFNNIIHKIHPDILMDHTNKLKGEADNLLVALLENFLKDWKDRKHNY
ncbi:TniQ family protein [Cytobacillus firmus]|uniref:TniQ family protein n=1 Tax=Cytobacillus firmus TaxID=1399 RepID=UPI0036BF8A1A